MILYLTDNLLKVERVVGLTDKSYCPAREDGIASMEYSEEAVKKLAQYQINFIIEVPIGATLPNPIALLPHPDNKLLGTNWYIPMYWKPEVAFYDVEYKTSSGEYKYKNKLSLAAFAKGYEAGFRITRVFSENGLTQEFLTRFNLRVITKGKFRYAAPNKK